MNPNNNHNVRLPRLAQAALWALAAVCGLLVVMPATSNAATAEFGADLSSPVTPVAAPEPCAAVPGAGCTRVATYYDDPSHAGGVPYAPKDGTIKQISLVAANPGSLKIQLAKVKGNQAKITTDGPKLSYLGTSAVETFKVHIPVKKGQWLAFKGKYADTLHCGAGFDTEVQFQPALPVGGPLTAPSGASDCTHLIGARMKY
jgi:hypothetical protein